MLLAIENILTEKDFNGGKVALYQKDKEKNSVAIAFINSDGTSEWDTSSQAQKIEDENGHFALHINHDEIIVTSWSWYWAFTTDGHYKFHTVNKT